MGGGGQGIRGLEWGGGDRGLVVWSVGVRDVDCGLQY